MSARGCCRPSSKEFVFGNNLSSTAAPRQGVPYLISIFFLNKHTHTLSFSSTQKQTNPAVVNTVSFHCLIKYSWLTRYSSESSGVTKEVTHVNVTRTFIMYNDRFSSSLPFCLSPLHPFLCLADRHSPRLKHSITQTLAFIHFRKNLKKSLAPHPQNTPGHKYPQFHALQVFGPAAGRCWSCRSLCQRPRGWGHHKRRSWTPARPALVSTTPRCCRALPAVLIWTDHWPRFLWNLPITGLVAH